MPDNRSRSRSPRRSSGSSYSKDHKQEDKPKQSASASHRAKDSRDEVKREVEVRKSKPTPKPAPKALPKSSPKSNNYTNPASNSGYKKERKFTGRCRLFVGNLVSCDEAELEGMFKKFGEVAETFVNKEKGFGFIRMDTRINAETAKHALDGNYRKGKVVRVRFAAQASALRVDNIGTYGTNDLLQQAFSQFGDVERAVVVCDDRGRSKGFGIVEFARKTSAMTAQQKINDNLFLLGRTPRPIKVKPLDQEEDDDGLPEKAVEKWQGYEKEREAGPHFATPGTFEREWAQRWRALEEVEQSQKESLDAQFREARDKLDGEMNQAIQEHEAMLMRQELQRRQEEVQRFEEVCRHEDALRSEIEIRRRQEDLKIQEELRRREERRHQEELFFCQQQDEIHRRRHQEDILLQDASMRSPGYPPRMQPPKGPPDWGPHPNSQPRMGPGMVPPRPPGPMGPRGPGMRPRFEQERERSRERIDHDRLAARSRELPPRDYGEGKRRKF